ncbi:MAG: transposase [Clostridia bacterium]|nr:transposase [Clostridia bacterium]
MAKKGQKFNKNYSDELISEVVNAYLNYEGSYRSLAEKYNIASWHTVDTWVRKYKTNNQIIRQKRGKRKNEEINYKARYEILKKYQAFLKEQQEKK